MNARSSLASRVAGAFRAPGASYLAEKAPGLNERRLIAYGFGAALFLTLGRVMAETIRPELAAGAERVPWFAATILIGFSFGVLALYAIAALIRLVCRAFGGEGGWAETRLALFWSGLAAGPLRYRLQAHEKSQRLGELGYGAEQWRKVSQVHETPIDRQSHE